MSFRRLRLFLPAFCLVATGALAQSRDVPLTNWTVPAYRANSASGGLTTMTDVTPGVGFVGVAPCRLVDTRQAGFPAGYGPPSLTQGQPRNFDLNSDPLCTGVPAGVDAYSLNITVTNTQGPGFILIYPQGGSQPTVSTVNYVAGQTIANAAIVPAGTNGGVTVIAGVSGTDLVIDINGYFTDQYNPGVSFHAVSSTAPAVQGDNTGSGYGVLGTSVSGFGVVASTGGSASNAALYATNTSPFVGSSGVFGWANASSGNIFGGKFITNSAFRGGAGVKGISGYGDPLGDGDANGSTGCADCWAAGVRGVDNNNDKFSHGVLGISKGNAVYGALLNIANPTATDAAGALGYRDVTNVKYGVISFGGSLATGVKSFADPHPTDASKMIRYVSLEGPESGTYFRGKGRFQRGLATVDVPEDFRMVTDPDGLSIQVTPIGQMASVAVVRIGLDQIVVQGSRDVEFFYLVNGVRRTFKDFQPIGEGSLFRPATPDSKLPEYLSAAQKRLLIENGTYQEDGTVNIETARRLGWDKEWEKRRQPPPQPTAD